MKKYIITEAQLKNVIDNIINEQEVITEDDRAMHFMMAVQEFLNYKLKANLVVDGKTGPMSKTEDAIMKYQEMIGANDDGVWGEETMKRMPQQDKQMFEKFKKKHGFGFFGSY